MMAMNSATGGGPVGGMAGVMNNGSPAMHTGNPQMSPRENLNTCIYDYFLKIGCFDLARKLHQEPKFEMRTKPLGMKQSPGRRKDGEMNGVDADGMDMDIKDDIPDDLPRPALAISDSDGLGFLYDWFCIFFELFSTARKPGDPNHSVARQYWNMQQSMQRLRENQSNQNMPRPGMVNPTAAQFAAMRGNMRNGMTNGDMQKATMSKSLTPMQLQQLQAAQQQQRMYAQQAQQQQMQREHSEMDMNGRPGTPADGENGGSPSKRPRLDGQQFNGGMVPNGRVQGMPGAQQQQMLMQTGFNPNNMNNANFRQNGAMQQKAMQGQMGNGMMNMPNAGSPMLQPMSDPQFPNGVPMDMYNPRIPGQPMPGGPAAQGGNHALQDYQMQLMLLEQQNKKRLMMARQEQDNITSRTDGPQLPGQVGLTQGMSPRSGTSPNPTEQMKRGAAQLGMPGSPSAGDLQGRSPAGGMGFMNNGMQPDFSTGMFMKQNEGMVGPGQNMRAPTTMDMGAMGPMRNQQGMRPGQFPGGQPMVAQNSQGQPQPMGTAGPRSEMPPPSAPATGNPNAQRAQPASPQQNQAPPTPSQTNKANPKKKGKDTSETRKKPNKKNSTANAPADPEPPATPTPSVPISPQHPNSFNNSAGKGVGPGSGPNAGPTSNPAAMPQAQMPPDLQNSGFPDFSNPTDQQFNLDFSTLETGDVLENFDFDSFLNTNADDGGFNFGADMDNFTLDPVE